MMNHHAATTLAHQLTVQRFAKGTPRSDAYRAGFRNLIYSQATGTAMPYMYPAGGTHFDAYYAGADEARPVWAEYLQTEGAPA